MRVGSLADLAAMPGMPSIPTIRNLIAEHRDFPVLTRGETGKAYRLDLDKAAEFIAARWSDRRCKQPGRVIEQVSLFEHPLRRTRSAPTLETHVTDTSEETSQETVDRLKGLLKDELESKPRHLVIAAAAATFVALFQHYNQLSTVAFMLRKEADRLDRMHALDTAAAEHSN